jgi:hypothetical protein
VYVGVAAGGAGGVGAYVYVGVTAGGGSGIYVAGMTVGAGAGAGVAAGIPKFDVLSSLDPEAAGAGG